MSKATKAQKLNELTKAVELFIKDDSSYLVIGGNPKNNRTIIGMSGDSAVVICLLGAALSQIFKNISDDVSKDTFCEFIDDASKIFKESYKFINVEQSGGMKS